jgi:tetratricopeptide (TPR) repeat protein
VGFNADKPLAFHSFARGVLAELGFLLDPQTSEAALVTQLTVRLAGKPCLLVLDQLEVLEPTPDWQWFQAFLQDWQQRGQTSTVLVTTRRSGLGDDQHLRLSGLSTPEGVKFLTEQQGLAAANLAELVALAEGHPLLLKLAAGWVKQTAGAQVDEAALDFFARLFAHYQGNPEAQVEEIFATLFAALPEALQTLLQRVSVYRDAFDLAAAQAMGTEVTAADLHTLVERAFLQPQDERWTLHPLMQALVRSALGQGAAWRQAHEQAALYFAECIVPWDGTLASCTAQLEITHHRCELGQYAAAKKVMATCVDLLDLRGYNRELVPVYERLTREWQAQAPTAAADQQNLAWAWITLGNTYRSLGQYQTAIAAHIQAQTLFAPLEFTEGIAAVLGNLGNAYYSLGQYQRAIYCHQQHNDIAREIGDRQGEATSLGNLGSAYGSLGQYQRVIDFQQQSLEIMRAIGDRQGEALSLGNLGVTYHSLGQYQRAIDFQQQSLEIERAIGNRQGEASSLGNLGVAYHSLRQYQRAIDFQQQSLEIERAIGNRQGEASSLGNLGNAYYSLGQYQRAIDCQQQSLEIERAIGNRQGEASSLGNLGNTYYSLGQY